MFYRVFLKLLFLLLLSGFVIGQMFAKAIKPHETIVYRTVDGRKLSLHCFYPGGVKQGEGRSAVIHFWRWLDGWASPVVLRAVRMPRRSRHCGNFC